MTGNQDKKEFTMKKMKKSISLVCAVLIMISALLLPNVRVDARAILTEEQSSPHGSFAAAQEIEQDYTLSGRISASSERDFYKVTFAESGKVNFWLGNIPSGCDYDLYLYDSSYNLLGKSTSTNSQELIGNYSVREGYTYYILVKSALGYSASEYYKLRCKWFPLYGFTYYSQLYPTKSSEGGYAVGGMENIFVRDDEISFMNRMHNEGCYITSFAMVLSNLNRNTGVKRYNPRKNEYGIMEPDPISVALANMGFPEMYAENVLDYVGNPVNCVFARIGNGFYSSISRVSMSNLTTQQKIVAITYYISINPEGVCLVFNDVEDHMIVATNSGYEASESEISTMKSVSQVVHHIEKMDSAFTQSAVKIGTSAADVAEYRSNGEPINDSTGGNYFTIFDPAYVGSNADYSSTLSDVESSQCKYWDNLTYLYYID